MEGFVVGILELLVHFGLGMVAKAMMGQAGSRRKHGIISIRFWTLLEIVLHLPKSRTHLLILSQALLGLRELVTLSLLGHGIIIMLVGSHAGQMKTSEAENKLEELVGSSVGEEETD